MKKKLLFYLLLVIPVLMSSCSDEPKSGSRSIDLTQEEEDVLYATNDAAWRMLNAMYDRGDDYTIFSPLSASICMSMIAAGAEGETQAEILRAIGYESLSIDDAFNFNKKVTHEIAGLDNSVQLCLANSLWANPQMEIKSEYKATLSKIFNAQYMDIPESNFTQALNDWINKKTNSQVQNIYADLLLRNKLYLINGMYFYGPWGMNYKFDKALTKEDVFHNLDGTESKAMFMNHDGFVGLTWKHESFSMLTLSLGLEGNYWQSAYEFFIILPYEEYGIQDCIAEIMKKSWKSTYSRMNSDYLVKLSLPKFDFESFKSLEETFNKLGVESLFENPDLSGMSDHKPLDQFVMEQSCRIKIDEDGAEAWVNPHPGWASGGPYGITLEYICDRPFIFVIAQKPLLPSTGGPHKPGAILFIGAINKM